MANKVKTVTPVSAVPMESESTVQQKEETTMHRKATKNTKATTKATKNTKATKATKANPARGKGLPLGKYATRKEQLIALAKKGITRDAVMALTGWDATKSVRGFFSTLKTIHRDTYDVNTKQNKNGETIYLVREK